MERLRESSRGAPHALSEAFIHSFGQILDAWFFHDCFVRAGDDLLGDPSPHAIFPSVLRLKGAEEQVNGGAEECHAAGIGPGLVLQQSLKMDIPDLLLLFRVPEKVEPILGRGRGSAGHGFPPRQNAAEAPAYSAGFPGQERTDFFRGVTPHVIAP